MYVSRAEAERKYKISITRQRALEKQGKLTPIDPAKVGYPQPNLVRGGAAIRVVYEEAQVAALKAKTSADARFARQRRRDALVFDMLAEGVSVTDIVRRLRLDLSTVKRLRDEYVKECDGFVVSGEVRRLAREHGFEIGPHNIVAVFVRLLEYGRGIKPSKNRLSRVKIVSGE